MKPHNLVKIAQAKEALEGLLLYTERNECVHEETERLGIIWTRCTLCGVKWADDSNFQGYKEPKQIEEARAAIVVLESLLS